MSKIKDNRPSENLSGMAIRGVVCPGTDEEENTFAVLPGDAVIIRGSDLLTEYSNRQHIHPIVRTSLVSQEIKDDIMELILNAMETFLWHTKDIAKYLKEELDKKYGAMWHVIIGEDYAFDITFETASLFQAYFGSFGILLWKCGAALPVEI
ncbi:DNAL4 [Lepeophtheirus salmonis]|uniref:Dynein light chain n=2 Tax=Lepeophtheirus salmonis TaxID=72036 RepID=A0A7R8CHZ2_LEPSM|nr:dynein light chain 4, axonemal-like [Lepeophtheirus salmonis]CAB4057928.1 DNAL4 [Lepeophtheirus salmonis]CAF2824582.1 DNAL4 [Lepeophtheirus salmonis]